jgi:heme/copper-type cytochrome/quinol oxidase subunit 2
MRWSVIVFGVAAVACAAAHIAILASVIRRRAAVVDANVPRPRAGVEIVWALVPVIAVAWLLMATWQDVQKNDADRAARIVKTAP